MNKSAFRNSLLVFMALLGIYLLFMACSPKPETEAERKARIAQGRLTAFEIDNGIGPIKEDVQVGPLDPQLAAKGEQIFNTKCTTCHKLDQKHTGPALRDVAKRRSPAYILNQILNPEEMAKFHPEGKMLVAKHMQVMTIQGITPDDARALLEYLRQQADLPPQPAAAK